MNGINTDLLTSKIFPIKILNEYFDCFGEGYLSICTLRFLLTDALLPFPMFQLSFLHLSVYLSWMGFLRDCQCDGKVLCAAMAFVCLTSTTCSCHTHPVSKTTKCNVVKFPCLMGKPLPAVVITTFIDLNFFHQTIQLTVKYSL